MPDGDRTNAPTRHSPLLALVTVLLVMWSPTHAAPAGESGRGPLHPDPERVADIAALLRETPAGLGPPISDRQHWNALARTPAYAQFADRSDDDLDTPIPQVTEAFYRRIVASGSRPEWYRMDRTRGTRFRRYVLAECLEDKGRFLPRIEQALATFFSEQTWFIPLYGSRSTDNFEGRANGIDLYKAMRSWEIALADWLLVDRLHPSTRNAVRENLERRTLGAFRAMIRGDQPPDWWLTTTNNWNAVCLAGVVGTALTVVESRQDRAFFVAAAERLSQNYLLGFPPDGYCTEGIGYWNFGFGHYLDLAETIHQATSGSIDLLEVPNIRNIALYGVRIEIINGVYPAIADCSANPSPSAQILWYASRRLGLGLREWEDLPLSDRASGNLYDHLIHAFPCSASAAQPAPHRIETVGRRSYFDAAGLLICRPGNGAAVRLGVCLKGGHNGEHHNHNDVGTFIVALGTDSPIADIGAEVYTPRTFSSERYRGEALNSYGHSVPVVAGQLQRPGREAAARVLAAEFSEVEDRFVLDLRAAYNVPELRSLERTFVYSRQDAGSLTVTDVVEFSSPQAFGVGLMTRGDARQTGPDSLLVFADREAVRVDIGAEPVPIEVDITPIDADLRGNGRGLRVGLSCARPVERARVTVRVCPARHPYVDADVAILNGGFEHGLRHWRISEDEPMTSVTTEQAFSGSAALRIVDSDPERGSSATSNVFRMQAGKHYELRGIARTVSGSDVGVVTRFYDARDRMLDLPDDDVRLAGTVFVGNTAGRWQPFVKTFTAPPGTHFGRLWLHSLKAALVEAYLDDLQIVPSNGPGRADPGARAAP